MECDVNLPDLLAWDEGIFKGLWRALRRRSAPPFDTARAAILDDELGRLTLLAQAIAGRRLLLRPSEALGGVRGPVLLLPTHVELAATPEGNGALYRLRAVVAAAMARTDAAPMSDPLAARVQHLARARDALLALADELPAFLSAWATAAELELEARPAPSLLGPRGAAFESAVRAVLAGKDFDPDALLAHLRSLPAGGADAPATLLWGDALSAADAEQAEAAARDAGLDARPPTGTERTGRPRDHVERALLDPDAPPESRPIHSFEKAEALDAWQGGHKTLDGADELAEHADALDEVDLRHVIRGGPAAESVYRCDAEIDGAVPDVGETPATGGVKYDEWDARAGRYRPDWATVYPSPFRAAEPAWGAAVARSHALAIRRLRRQLAGQRLARVRCPRQTDGEDIDLDAVVDAFADRHAGRTGSDRLYVAGRPLRADRATTVLLDVSLSADGWVEGQRVLDVTRSAVLVLGEVLEPLGDALSVASFATHTRHHCHYWQLKDFDEAWLPARNRLGAVKARGYTRLGPAVRHATASLAARPERHKLMVLLTDGKPTDFDRYEGRHGREDVARAVGEARRAGVVVHALGFDVSARAALPAMFGVGGWSLVRHVAALPDALTRAYARLDRGGLA